MTSRELKRQILDLVGRLPGTMTYARAALLADEVSLQIDHVYHESEPAIPKAPAGTGVGNFAIALLKLHPERSNSELARNVRQHFARVGAQCATTANCIAWYRAGLRSGRL